MKDSYSASEFNDLIKKGVIGFNKKGRAKELELTPKYKENMNKYNAQKTEYNGVKFDSKKEAEYARKLDVLTNTTVKSYETQIRMPIVINGLKVCTYICDFKVAYLDGTEEYIDVKGMKSGCAYQMFRLKKKLVEAVYNIVIKEV